MRHVIILTVLAVFAAACGTSAGSGETTTTTLQPTTTVPTTTTTPKVIFDGGSTDRVLVIDDEGGFAPVELILNRLPRYVLYGDGTLLSPAPVPAIFPGPILAPVQSVRLDSGELSDIARLVEEIGLPDIDREIDDTLNSRVADATTTVATYVDPQGDEHVYGTYALGLVPDEPVDPRSESLGQLVRRLDKALTSANEASLYEPTGIQLWLGEPYAGDEELSETIPWPLPVTPNDFEPEGDFDRPCHVLLGDAAAAAIETFSEANAATVWEYEGEEYGLIARPLLPGEPGCIP